MQKTKTTINNKVESNLQNNQLNNKNDKYNKLIKFDSINDYGTKKNSNKPLLIKRIFILILCFLLMVTSIVGAALAIVEVKNKEASKKETQTSIVVQQNK